MNITINDSQLVNFTVKFRHDLRLTQKEFGRFIGLSEVTVNNFETGNSTSKQLLFRIYFMINEMQRLGIDLNNLQLLYFHLLKKSIYESLGDDWLTRVYEIPNPNRDHTDRWSKTKR